jgi:outer membrane autotransporter protein
MALTYTNVDASYDGGGGFDKHVFGHQIYATWLPFSSAFVDLVLGYARSENDNRRRIFVERNVDTLTARTSADYAENIFSATLRFGYDYPIDNVTIGPRAGFFYAYSLVPSFEEDGNSGLELRYNGLDHSSVQTSLGLLASVSIERPWGVVIPQASVAWGHEYADGARNVDAKYIDAEPSPNFRFKREQVARDWALVGIGATALLPRGFQPFVGFSTMLGNENFTTYGGFIGLRKAF